VCRQSFTKRSGCGLNQESHWTWRKRPEQVQVHGRANLQRIDDGIHSGRVPRRGEDAPRAKCQC